MEFEKLLVFSDDSKNISVVFYNNNAKKIITPEENSKLVFNDYIKNKKIKNITSINEDRSLLILDTGEKIIIDKLSKVLTACIGSEFNQKYTTFILEQKKEVLKEKTVTKAKNVDKKQIVIPMVGLVLISSFVIKHTTKKPTPTIVEAISYADGVDDKTLNINHENSQIDFDNVETTLAKTIETTREEKTEEVNTIEEVKTTEEPNTTEETKTTYENYENYDYYYNNEKLNYYDGVCYYNNHRETYYEEEVLPGNGLDIPGRHVASDGTIRDKDGYICVASDFSYLPLHSTLETSLGPAKVYDTGCAYGTIDVYVNGQTFRNNYYNSKNR